MNALIYLHGARWRMAGEKGMIEMNRLGGFLREAAAKLAARNMLRLFTLRLNEKIVAILLALRTPTTIFSYLSGFDPQYEKFGFGRELLARAFQYAHAHDRFRNFLRGEESYKFSWGARLIPKCRLLLMRHAEKLAA
jgi:CelD/BcsL family acetyltransferase involved in cellulose biosynthesis